MEGSWSGKAALVTGASSGIGRATALALGRQGARLSLVGRRAEALDALVAEITAAGGEAQAHPADLLDGSGSGGKDDEVGEVLAQVFRKSERDPAAPHAGLGQGSAGVGGDQNGVGHWSDGSNCYLANSSAIPAARGDLRADHSCDQLLPHLWQEQGNS